MALVRRTKDLKEKILEQFDALKKEKISSLLKPAVRKQLEAFYLNVYNSDILMSENMRNFILCADRQDFKNVVGFIKPHFYFNVNHPAGEYWRRFHTFNWIPSDDMPLVPVLGQSPIVWSSADKRFGCTYHASDSESGFIFNVNISKLVHDPGTGPEFVCTYQTMPKNQRYNEFTAMLNYSDSLPDAQKHISEELFELKSNVAINIPLAQDFLELKETVGDAIWNTCERFNKSEEYIFSELWKLPSLNKMVEFFPGIRAFCPQDILDRLDKGATRRKEYNVSLPDKEVVVNATETSIKS